MKKLLTVLLCLVLVFSLAACGAKDDTPQPPKTLEVQFSADLPGYFFDYAMQYRFDYIPVFEEGAAPTESPEYLLWAFAINLDNWGDQKGKMTAEYVEEMVEKHFGVTELEHQTMFKCWNYADGIYTAVPSGIKELPMFALTAASATETEDGYIFRLEMDECMLESGYIPTEADYDEARNNISNGERFYLKTLNHHIFTFSLDENSNPVFLSHSMEYVGE